MVVFVGLALFVGLSCGLRFRWLGQRFTLAGQRVRK